MFYAPMGMRKILFLPNTIQAELVTVMLVHSCMCPGTETHTPFALYVRKHKCGILFLFFFQAALSKAQADTVWSQGGTQDGGANGLCSFRPV